MRSRAKTAHATKSISNTLVDLNKKARQLSVQGAKSADAANRAKKSTSAILETLNTIELRVSQFVGEMSKIDGSAKSVQTKSAHMSDAVASLSSGFLLATAHFERIEKSTDQLQTVSEGLLTTTLTTELETPHSRFVQGGDATGVRSWQNTFGCHLSIAQTFDKKCRPIPGSNPAQFETSYCKLFDRLLQALFDGALDFDPRVFSTAVDVNGFLPTRNSKVSQPQGQDAVWNAANCKKSALFQRPGSDLRPGKMKKRFSCRLIVATWEGADLSPWLMFRPQSMSRAAIGAGCGSPMRSISPRNESFLAQTYLQLL